MSLLCVTKGRHMRKCLDGMLIFIILIVRMLTFIYRWEISNCTLISLNILLLVVLESNSGASNRQSKYCITELHPQVHICGFVIYMYIYIYILYIWHIYTYYIYTYTNRLTHTHTHLLTHIHVYMYIYIIYIIYMQIYMVVVVVLGFELRA
jgi:hypothetical protein